jgi:hypothetical protein
MFVLVASKKKKTLDQLDITKFSTELLTGSVQIADLIFEFACSEQR